MAVILSNGALAERARQLTMSAVPVFLSADSDTIQILSGTIAQTLNLPDATQLYAGMRFVIINRSSTATITVNDGDSVLLATVTPLSQSEIRLLSVATSAGSWDVSRFASSLGEASNGTYEDGLFTEFTPATGVGYAVDKINELLKLLAPPPAPALASLEVTTAGTSSKLSFGTFNAVAGYTNTPTVNINQTFSNASGTLRGAYGTTTVVGSLANSVVVDTGSPNPSYPAKAFGNGDKGFLRLMVNGSMIHQTDLSTFTSGNSYNANNSGFVLIVATSVKFPNGNTLPIFQYRTGTFRVTAADQRTGYNVVQVVHYVDGVTSYLTNNLEWVYDSDATALTATSASLSGLNMTGARTLSGVTYHTGGTALYNVTINNAYKNIYSASATPITYTGTNGAAAAEAIPNMTTQNDVISIVNKTVTHTANTRNLNGSLGVSVNCAHPLKAALSNAGSATIANLLVDAVVTAATDIFDGFDSENARLQSVTNGAVNNYINQADIAAGTWSSAISLVSATVGYNDGLLYYNSDLRYPTQGANSGNFSGIANGPAGNVNYSGATGSRTVYLKIRNNTGSTKANLTFVAAGSGTSFVSLVTGASAQNITASVKFPNGSIGTGTGWLDCFADFATGQFNDGNGARNAGAGAGRATGTTWGITFGTKSIANNEYIIFRLTASAAWTGLLSSFSVTWT